MSRRSILSSVTEEQPKAREGEVQAPKAGPKEMPRVKASRRAKLHLGGYYDPKEPTVIAFQKLGIDLRKTQQEMLMEALRDYVAKHLAATAFQPLA